MIEKITLNYDKEAFAKGELLITVVTDNGTSVVTLPAKRLTLALERIFDMADDECCQVHFYDFTLYFREKENPQQYFINPAEKENKNETNSNKEAY